MSHCVCVEKCLKMTTMQSTFTDWECNTASVDHQEEHVLNSKSRTVLLFSGELRVRGVTDTLKTT